MDHKFLNAEGLSYLWSKISMKDYPNNETLMAVINAIDETKADKDEIKNLASETYVDNAISNIDFSADGGNADTLDGKHADEFALISDIPDVSQFETQVDALIKLTEAKSYTDIAVADLVNSAPETLDTLGELAAAFQENADMVETLDAAVTNKAEKSDLDNLAELVDINATNIEFLQAQVLPTSLILADAITGVSYTIQIQNGQLVSFETTT